MSCRDYINIVSMSIAETLAAMALLKWYISWQEDQVLPVPGPAIIRHLYCTGVQIYAGDISRNHPLHVPIH